MPTGLGDEKLWLCPSLDDSADDISGNGNHGTYNGGMGTVADASNGGTRAYFFDDVDDYISNTSLSLSGLSKFSYSGWIYDDDATSELSSVFSYAKLYSYSDDIYFFSYVGELRIQVNNGADGQGSATQWGKSQWNHIAVVFDGTQSTNADRLKYYLNGSQVSLSYDYTVPSSTGSPATPKQIEIGRYAGFTTHYYSGKQDDIRVFDRALTTSEITALASKRGYEVPAVSNVYHPFAALNHPLAQ